MLFLCYSFVYVSIYPDDGCVYVWGSGSEGQLGLGMSQQEAAVPVQLELEEKVKSLSCGYYHTAVVTGNGLDQET